MFQRHFQPRSVVAFGALFAGTVVLYGGCSSNPGSGAASGSSNMTDAGPVHRGDAGSTAPDAGTPAGGSLYDGTVGQVCTSDADCQPPGGPGINVCSSSLQEGVLFPTPVCA